MEADWKKYSPINEKLIPPNAISYLLAEGGDLAAPARCWRPPAISANAILPKPAGLEPMSPYLSRCHGRSDERPRQRGSGLAAHFSPMPISAPTGNTVQHHRSSGGNPLGPPARSCSAVVVALKKFLSPRCLIPITATITSSSSINPEA